MPSFTRQIEPATEAPAPSDRRGRFLRDLRVSVTDHCNLRCSYCLPEEVFGPGFRFLPESRLLAFDEIVRLVAAFSVLGIGKIRLTGGEPLLRAGLPELVARLREAHPGHDLALTTNGLHMDRQGADLRAAGLDRINISLDALDPAVARALAGRHADPEKVWQAVLFSRDLGLKTKLNTVIQRGVNESEILPLARRCREAGVPIRFIEYMDVGTRNKWDRTQVVTGKQIRMLLSEEFDLEPVTPAYPGETARRCRYADGAGEVGFINSISEPFCGGCTRARIAADGALHTCLFAASGPNLATWLRDEGIDDTELLRRLRTIWRNRDDRYSEERFSGAGQPAGRRTEMWALGG